MSLDQRASVYFKKGKIIMTDIVVDFMDRLRQEWPEVPVIAGYHITNQTNVMGVSNVGFNAQRAVRLT